MFVYIGAFFLVPSVYKTSQMRTIGSRIEVYNGEASRTAGGLTKKDLKLNARGKVVSKKASAAAMRNNSLGLKPRKGGVIRQRTIGRACACPAPFSTDRGESATWIRFDSTSPSRAHRPPEFRARPRSSRCVASVLAGAHRVRSSR